MEEDLSREVFRRRMTMYSPEMKISLLNEYKAVASKVSITQFARDYDLCLCTFYCWMKKTAN